MTTDASGAYQWFTQWHTRSRLVHRVLWTIICALVSQEMRYPLLRINDPAGCETVCNHKQISLHAYLTICSETGLFWNLTGRSRMGFTVKHWMSACRKVKGLNDDSNWNQLRWHLLQLDFCLIFNSTQYILPSTYTSMSMHTNGIWSSQMYKLAHQFNCIVICLESGLWKPVVQQLPSTAASRGEKRWN